MDALTKRLCEELRQTEQEILQSLQQKTKDHLLKPILEEELKDIRSALTKVNKGNYGLCEISGELIPNEFLTSMPTLKSLQDLKKFKSFFRKPLYF